jgi:hypothetical protein
MFNAMRSFFTTEAILKWKHLFYRFLVVLQHAIYHTPQLDMPLYMRIANELYLKRLIVVVLKGL